VELERGVPAALALGDDAFEPERCCLVRRISWISASLTARAWGGCGGEMEE